jgi:hypothetical protein
MRIALRVLAVALAPVAVVALMAPVVSGQGAGDKLYAGT